MVVDDSLFDPNYKHINISNIFYHFQNIFAGVIYGMVTGFIMCCILTSVGSALCYLLSEYFGRRYVMYFLGEKLAYLQRKIDENGQRLLPFLLFFRMFPMAPCWLLNIVAPFLNIPLSIFSISTLIGKQYC